MLLSRALGVTDVQAMFAQYNQVIELMLNLAAERSEFESTLNARQTELDELRHSSDSTTGGLDPYVSCFVAMPFRDPRATRIYEAVRSVLEDKPFYWRVVRADDTAELPGLWDNLKAKLLRAHCYIAILNQTVNPNVMIEIGRMEALERPLVLLRDTAAPELPADLKGRLYAEIDPDDENLITIVRDTLNRQDALHQLTTGDRYLSDTVLKRDADLSDRVSREISRRYETWRAFLAADDDQVARLVDSRPATIRGAKESLLASEN